MSTREMTCVRRNIGWHGAVDMCFVPIEEVQEVIAGEALYTGVFHVQPERHGPYGTDLRSVCSQAGSLSQSTAVAGYKQQCTRPRRA